MLECRNDNGVLNTIEKDVKSYKIDIFETSEMRWNDFWEMQT